MMRGFARSILSAMPANRSARPRSRPAAAGISAVSRAIALAAGDSALATFELVDRGPQIAAMPLEQLRGLGAARPKAKQDGRLQVAVRLLEMPYRVAFRATDDLPDDGERATTQLGVPRFHVHHQAAIDPAHLHHQGG